MVDPALSPATCMNLTTLKSMLIIRSPVYIGPELGKNLKTENRKENGKSPSANNAHPLDAKNQRGQGPITWNTVRKDRGSHHVHFKVVSALVLALQTGHLLNE